MTSDLRGPDCPGCGGAMARLPAREGVFAGCRTCGGLWADSAISSVIISNEMDRRGRMFAQEIAAAAGGAPPAGYRSRAAGTERRCPTCRDRLVERPYGDPPVTLDVCNAHGTYFDVRELEAVFRHLAMMEATAEAASHVARAERDYAALQRGVYGNSESGGGLLGYLGYLFMRRG
jgi:Zn-finger nucleic acid-binding protein